MIRRLRVENYKCLVDVELDLKRHQLLLGANGAGKTALFEVVQQLRNLALGRCSVSDAFPTRTLTRWHDDAEQRFELTLDAQDGRTYEYRLRIDHDRERAEARIGTEELVVDGGALYAASGASARVFLEPDEGPLELRTGADRSGISFVDPNYINKRLRAFRTALEHVHVVKIDPRSMVARSERPTETPATDLSNFASWYRHLVQTRFNDVASAIEALKSVFEGFDTLNVKRYGDDVGLLEAWWMVRSKRKSTRTTYSFDELSDGQRALIGLYCVLHSTGSDEQSTLCLDEPDNFLALREIQPFMRALLDRENVQSIVVSHHPETIDYVAPVAALRFARHAGQDVTVRALDAKQLGSSSLRVSELEARGWDDES